MNITPQNNPKEFEQFLFNQIDLDHFHYKFLKDYLQAAIAGTKKLYDKSVLNIAPDGGWMLILHGEGLLIYGENWNTNQFDEIRKIIDLNQFNNFTIIGNTELVDSLLKFYKVTNVCVRKDRILYRTRMIEKFENQNLKIALGNISEQNELASMLQQYYHEEYKGANDKSIEEMQMRILQVINARKIVVLKNSNDQLLGFCTIIDPDIGILFTKTEHRKLGYGKILLSYCSTQLMKKNGEVFLMTDKNETASNKTCESVGFKGYFNNTFLQINCD